MNNIYMGYLTEKAREELILEKEIDMFNIDMEYLFTTYETVDNDKKQNILKRIWINIKKFIKRLREEIIPNILNIIKKKEDEYIDEVDLEVKTVMDNDLNSRRKLNSTKKYKKIVYTTDGNELFIKVSKVFISNIEKIIQKIDNRNLTSKQIEDIFVNNFEPVYNQFKKDSSSSMDMNTKKKASDQNILYNLKDDITKYNNLLNKISNINDNIYKLNTQNNDDIISILTYTENIIGTISHIISEYKRIINSLEFKI